MSRDWTGESPGDVAVAAPATNVPPAPPPTPFDVHGPLPTGTTVLEASAGTGKTYTIAALAARYVAEGHAELHQLMIVTFGRMATDELRVRVRDRLVRLEAQLTEALGRTPPWHRRCRPGTTWPSCCSPSSASELARRHERVVPGAGGLRRRHHRHHARVLSADARRPRGARRPGAGRGVRGAPGRADRRGGPRRLPAPVRDRGATAAEVRGRAESRRGRRPGRSDPAGARPRSRGPGRRAGRLRPRGGRRGAAAQGARPLSHLRRHAHPAAGRPGRPAARRAGRAAPAGPLPGGAGRRVPGHRPDPVGHPATGVPPAQHAGRDRGPEAGDLRLPRRRREQLPAGRPRVDHDRHPRHLLPQRPGAAGRPRPDHGRRQSRRSRHRGPPGGQRPPHAAARPAPGLPSACGCCHPRRTASRST